MSRYIDADAVESTLQEMEMITAMSHIELGEEDDDVGEISMPMLTVRNIMKTAPSIDIVRCKECKFSEVWESTAGNELYCEKQRICPYDWGTLTAFYVKPDDFCSIGERKESE